MSLTTRNATAGGRSRASRVAAVGAVAALVFVAAACGSDDDQRSSGTDSPATDDSVSATDVPTTDVPTTEGSDTTTGGTDVATDELPVPDGDYKIAVLMPVLAAGYPAAVTEYIKARADATGVEVQVFDANFDPSLQFTQCQDVLAAGDFDGLIILAASSPSMIQCAEEAEAAGLPVIATNTPIGNETNSTEIQSTGVKSQVFVTGEETYKNVTDAVLDACADLDPCNVGNILIVSAIAISQAQDAAMKALADENPNINIVGTAEGGAQRSGGLQAAQDFLQSEPNLHVLVSGADDMLLGAEEALTAAGLRPGVDVAFIGQGGSFQAVERLRKGEWTAISVANAKVEGELPIDLMIRFLNGETIDSYYNSTEVAGLAQLLNADNIADFPDFEGTFDS